MSNVLKIDFSGQAYSFTTDGWLNATQAASRYQKKPIDWLRQRDTVEYICALAEEKGNSGFLPQFNEIIYLHGDSSLSRVKLLELVKSTGLVKIKGGSPENGGGTWFHSDLAVVFARWLNIKFAVWCDLRIKEIIRASYEPPNMIKLLLADTVSEWELRFPPSYYQALAKVTKTNYKGHSHGTPSVFGQITLKWIYSEILPPDVLAEVKARKKDSEKMHQWLSKGGEKQLDQQITKIEAIASSSVDYDDFAARCMQSCKAIGQLHLVLSMQSN
ncbi:P63C domain-containing protein [Agitococcus lubricus]|uniref:KilA domain-containing protein n=1 Tax=Agitococcus lubricus TaxID=1077255 RepID=A0A2T5ISI6_9GAMM|nr:P63C domain-containing protein [Agitococcus lubricus]PTQ86796.1 KilA domain-containing protein [Agitococcus lubricus]